MGLDYYYDLDLITFYFGVSSLLILLYADSSILIGLSPSLAFLNSSMIAYSLLWYKLKM